MKSKTEFVCTECGYKASKWYGRCPNCSAWNSFTEEETRTVTAKAAQSKIRRTVSMASQINQIEIPDQIRIDTGISEFDRVLGGGIVQGSVVLLSGEPGIGKSTMLMQVCGSLGNRNKLLYVSGEESPGQLKLRAKRLGISSDNLYILAETDVNEVCEEIDIIKPDIVIIDSIQTMCDKNSFTSAGSVSQVKNAASSLIQIAKTENIAILIVGHVNKDGAIAGPKVLEHMVDTVLYFEGERQHSYRILRAVKNRFGSTNEIGVFEMQGSGLIEVENPSEMLLSQRSKNVSGNCTFCVMEGSRPILAEVQALVTLTAYPSPKRMTTGFDYNRMSLLAAVLEKRLGLRFSSQDVYINIAGGLRVDEPASDLAAALALISGYKDIPVPETIVAIGEIGLSGECRAVGNIEQRVSEAIRLGFSKIVLPKRSFDKLTSDMRAKVEFLPVRSIYEALNLFK